MIPRRPSSPLTEKQVAAVQILLYRRYMPTTEKSTTHKAINRTTAWGLEEAGLAYCWWVDSKMGERVRLLPAAKQLVRLGRKMGKVF